jgi:hypothetical protein
MRLHDTNLVKYFSYIPEVWRTYPVYPYNFIDRNSNTLVVTIGDSWTFGADICLDDYAMSQERLDKMYGNIVASNLGADFLSLGQSGTCNLYIINKITELDTLIPQLDYTNIIIICTFTEACRTFDGPFDKHNDYVTWFSNQTFDSVDKFDSIIKYHNGLQQDSIVELAAKYQHVKVIVGTNFVDPIGMNPAITILSKSWLQVYSEQIINQEYLGHCYIMSHWVLDKLPGIITGFKPDIDRTLLLQWMCGLTESAMTRKQLVSDSCYFRGINHPLAEGHRVWADYLLEQLQ